MLSITWAPWVSLTPHPLAHAPIPGVLHTLLLLHLSEATFLEDTPE